MKDFTLCAPNSTTMMAALDAADMVDPDTTAPLSVGPGWALDVIGDYPGGYWANLRYEADDATLPVGLAVYAVTRPDPPYRQWA